MIYVNVTNTFKTVAKTGIQRVVREIASRVNNYDNFCFVVWHETDFYQLSDDVEMNSFMDAVSFVPKHKLNLSRLCDGDVFFDIDASWGDPYDVMQLFYLLKKNGVILVKMHYDAVPILFSKFAHQNTVFRFTDNFSAALQYVDYWLCISKTVDCDLLMIAKNLGVGRVFSEVIPLGSDFTRVKRSRDDESFTTTYGRYILTVGTVEPRKNHQLTLDVFEALLLDESELNLVIVGKQGWDVDVLAKRIEKHKLFNKKIFWLKSATDAELSLLYSNAFVAINLSHYEGYGLPVIEALSQGCVTLCAKGGALEEVASGAAYCVESDVRSVADAIRALTDSSTYSEFKNKADNFTSPTWNQAAEKIVDFFKLIQKPKDISFVPQQVVYISIRPDALHRSLSSVIKNMEFITQAVILASDASIGAIAKRIRNLSIDIILIKESDLGIVDLPTDHQIRNTFLRRKLYQRDEIEPNFIAFDDDYLALKPVHCHDFLEDGKHKAYYYDDDGRDWLGAKPPTSFDRGAWRTTKYLYSSGYDTKMYGAHMPQIINKEICNRILNRTADLGLDEWSVYFNIAKHLYPIYFEDAVYRAIGWPNHFNTWLPSRRPEVPLFENFYEDSLEVKLTAEEKTERFMGGYNNAYLLRKSIVPECPTVTVDDEGLHFNGEQLVLPDAIDLKIFFKLLIDECFDKYRLTIKFTARTIVVDHKFKTRFIHIEVGNIIRGSNNIHLSFSLPDEKDKFELTVPVTLSKDASKHL